MTREILLAAREGLEAQRARIDEQLRQVELQLAKLGTDEPRETRLSPTGRERIAAAQKKRWQEYRKKIDFASAS